MKGLKIIPLFLILIILSYFGLLFVQANPTQVSIVFFGGYETEPIELGFVLLTAALVGMMVAGVLCLLELVVLYIQNKSMARRLKELEEDGPNGVTSVVASENETASKPTATSKLKELTKPKKIEKPATVETTDKSEKSQKSDASTKKEEPTTNP